MQCTLTSALQLFCSQAFPARSSFEVPHMSKRRLYCVAVLSLAIGSAFLLSGCGSSNSPTNTSMGAVNVMVSDPATCSGPKGSLSHIFITITDVEIHSSSSAGPNDAGWIDLTPGLKQNPMQVDLLAL